MVGLGGSIKGSTSTHHHSNLLIEAPLAPFELSGVISIEEKLAVAISLAAALPTKGLASV